MKGRVFRWITLFLVTAGFLTVGLLVFLRNPPREPDTTSDDVAIEQEAEPEPEPEPLPEPTREEPAREADLEDGQEPAANAAAPEIRVERYVVKSGDSLSQIAREAYSDEERARGAHWLTIYVYSADNGILDPASTPIVSKADRYSVNLDAGQELLIPFYPGDFPFQESILARFGVNEEAEIRATGGDEAEIPRLEGWSAPAAARRWLRLAGRLGEASPEPEDDRPVEPRGSEPAGAEPGTIAPPVESGLSVPAAREGTEPPEPAQEPSWSRQEPAAAERQSSQVVQALELPRAASEPQRPRTPQAARREPEPLQRETVQLEPPPEFQQPEPVAAIPPAISLSAPARGNFYGETLLIEGQVQASRGVEIARDQRALEELVVYFDGRREEADAVYWDVTSGSFRALLQTAELTGLQTVVVEARNDAGERTSVRVPVYDGNTPPSISLTSPDTEYGYGAFLEIAGRAVDATEDLGQPRGVERIRYEIQPADFAIVQDLVEGEIRPRRDGSFEAVIPTEQFKGTQLVVLTARGVNGAEGEISFELSKANTAIPRITATGGNRAVTLDWSPLPGAREYRVYYRSATTPRPGADTDEEPRLWEESGITEIEVATPPYTVRGLDNRVRYEFQVVTGRRGREAWSEVVENVPLTGRELSVSATNDFDAIALRWRPLPSISRYAVWRKGDNEAEYLSVATVEGSEYRDETVRYGIRYAYRIAPDIAGAVMSPAVYGLAASVPQEAITSSALAERPGPSALTVAGEYVVVSDREGFALLDIWNLPTVTRRGELSRVGQMRAMDSWDRYVLGAETTGRVRVIDTGDSNNPRVVYSSGDLDAQDLAVVPTSSRVLVFLARNRRGLEVSALEESPVSLRELGADRRRESLLLSTLAAPEEPDLIHLASASPDAINLYSVRPDGVPRLQGSLSQREVTDLHLIADASGAPLLLATTGSEFLVIDPLPRPRVRSRVPIVGASAVRGVAYHDGSLFGYVGSSSNGVTVFDLSDPEEPIQFAVAGERRAVAALALHYEMTGEVTVVAATDQGTAFYEAHTVGRSRTVATVVTPGRARQVRLADSRRGPMVLVADTSGVAAMGARNAVRLRESAAEPERYISVGSDVTGVDAIVDGGRTLLFAADREEGLFLYDLDRPRQPLAHLSADLMPLDVLAEGRADGTLLAYVLDERWGLVIVDVTDPETPIQRSATRVVDPRGFCRVGDRLYLADAGSGIVIVDVSNTTLPETVRTVDLPGARDIHLHQKRDGSVIGLAVTSNGLVVLSSEGAHPEELALRGTYQTQFAERVYVDEEYALVNEGVLGLNVLDLSNPDRPRRVSGSDLTYASGATRFDSYAFAVDGSDLQILEILVPPWLEGSTSRR